MRTRTRLTTPPGQEPALSDDSGTGGEVYVPGLELPREARVPGRRRRLWIALALVVLVVLAGWALFLTMTAGQSFDPALEPEFGSGTQDTPPAEQSTE